jgi:polar amino acid transport system substrate-binding protein
MKRFITLIAALALFAQVGCGSKKSSDEIHFGVSADYPPFEYKSKGEVVGFDIDLANHIADELGKKAVFHDMDFSAILPALQSEIVDAAISTITITEKRSVQYDFSREYFFEEMFLVFDSRQQIGSVDDLKGKKVACQLGTTMEIWLRKNCKSSEITAMDNNSLAIETLKSGLADTVLMDGFQAKAFCKKNPQLGNTSLIKSSDGYGIAFKKGSPLRGPVDRALQKFVSDGTLEKLAKKWELQ